MLCQINYYHTIYKETIHEAKTTSEISDIIISDGLRQCQSFSEYVDRVLFIVLINKTLKHNQN